MEAMNITSAQYRHSRSGDEIVEENSTIIASIDGVEMTVPVSEANRHYAEIMRQVEAGTLTIQDAE